MNKYVHYIVSQIDLLISMLHHPHQRNKLIIGNYKDHNNITVYTTLHNYNKTIIIIYFHLIVIL